MIHRILLLFFAFAGILSTFLPWIQYPQADMSVYGYMGDGVLSGFAFLFILIYTIISFKKPKINYIWALVIGLLSIGLLLLAYTKIQAVEAEKLTFQTNDPSIALLTAGFHQGSGLYVMGIAGLGILVVILGAMLDQGILNRHKKDPGFKSRKSSSWITAAGGLILTGLITFVFFQSNHKLIQNKNNDFESLIRQDIYEMGLALADGNYEIFVDFNHPTVVQSLGGKQPMAEIVEKAMEGQKESGIVFEGSELLKVMEVHSKGKLVQAIIQQQLSISRDGESTEQIQSMLALSEDSGVSWHYINLENRTREEIIRTYPQLIADITF